MQQNKLIYLIYKNHEPFFLLPLMSFHLCVVVSKPTIDTDEEIYGHACIMHFIYLQTNQPLIVTRCVTLDVYIEHHIYEL